MLFQIWNFQTFLIYWNMENLVSDHNYVLFPCKFLLRHPPTMAVGHKVHYSYAVIWEIIKGKYTLTLTSKALFKKLHLPSAVRYMWACMKRWYCPLTSIIKHRCLRHQKEANVSKGLNFIVLIIFSLEIWIN